MVAAAKGLKVIVPNIGLIASSPLLRAVQTAEILYQEYHDVQLIKTDVLRPGLKFLDLINWLQHQPATGVTALVGHEPDLSYLTCRLLTGDEQPFLHFKKGGTCLVESPENIQAGNAHLLWFITPGELRKIGAAG